MTDNNSNKSTAEQQQEGDFVIKPSSTAPTLDTSKWPLLLKVNEE